MMKSTMQRAWLLFATLSLSTWHSTLATIESVTIDKEIICTGTESGIFSLTGSAAWRYEDYKRRYSNCTYINGSLELTHLDQFDHPSTEFNLDFLSQIKEISGYVLIHKVCSRKLPLTSLRVIRGQRLFEHNGLAYAMYVGLNDCPLQNISLEEVQLSNFREIMTGGVLFENNAHLCYVASIQWISITASNVVIDVVPNGCASCDVSCPKTGDVSHCWGPGPDLCQFMPKTTNCDSACGANRCFGSAFNECCAAQCVGGCSGPTARDCVACKAFRNGEECVDSCPSVTQYNSNSQQYEQVPLLTLVDAFCVDRCPSPAGEENGACVFQCANSNTTIQDGKCVPCGDHCDKRCKGMAFSEYLTPTHAEMLNGCNVVDGSIVILESSFVGNNNLSLITVDQLAALESVRDVSGYIVIDAPQISNLSFLRNLEVIRGETTDFASIALRIRNTSATSLDLQRLRRIEGAGGIHIEDNARLCYVHSINWTRIAGINYKDRVVLYGSPSTEKCAELNETCDKSCGAEGCWGPGDQECLSCVNFRFEGRCIATCSEIPLTYDAGNGICERCNEECADGCSASDALSCVGGCRHFRHNDVCVASCPLSTYVFNATCEHCHVDCLNCTGPGNAIEDGSCSVCRHATVHFHNGTTVCMNEWDGIPMGYFATGGGPHSHYLPCDDSCLGGCSGPTNQDCYACKAKLRSSIHDADVPQSCYVNCPITHIYMTVDEHTGEMICYFDRTTLIVALCVSIPLALALIASVIVRFYRNHRGAMNKISVQMSNIDDPDDESIPLTSAAATTGRLHLSGML